VKAPAEAEAHTHRDDSTAVDEVAFQGWRSSPNKRRARLLATRLADLTVGDLLAILDDLDRGRHLSERGLL
jgi:hypothetical protein